MQAPAWWYRRSMGLIAWLLLPLSYCYRILIYLRRCYYRWKKPESLPVPIIVVGNISVGGTGKTPLVAGMAKYLRARGWRVGLISRGYGGQASNWPQWVTGESDPRQVGDEPVMLVHETGCPMAVGPDRVAAVRYLLAHTDCNIVLSDDGLQHYRLPRELDIAVLDGVRRLGNGQCLPAGPLREPASRLAAVDAVVVTGGEPGAGEYLSQLVNSGLRQIVDSGQVLSIEELRGQSVHAVAAIGHPERFFQQLRDCGVTVIPHPLPDHHVLGVDDITFDDDLIVLMTAKDAVKCQAFATKQHWVWEVEVSLSDEFWRFLDQRVGDCN